MTSETPEKVRLTKATAPCWRCEDAGWYWRTPDGFNPFSAGGWSTIRAMYRQPCSCPAGRAALQQDNSDE